MCTSSSSSDAPERVLPTIVSRCQVVEFQPVADDELLAFLVRARGPRAPTTRRSSRGSPAARSSAPRGWSRTSAARATASATCAWRPASPCTTATPSAPSSTRSQRRDRRRRARSRADLARRRAELERTVPDDRERALHTRAPRRPAAARAGARIAPGGAGRARPPACLLRDLWVVACGAAGALEPRPAGRARARGRRAPEHLRAPARGPRRDAQGSVPERRPQARPAGDVLPFPGGRDSA